MRRAAESARAGICEGRVRVAVVPQCVRARTAAAFFSNPSSQTTCPRARRAALLPTLRPCRCAGKMFTREPDERLRREVPPPPFMCNQQFVGSLHAIQLRGFNCFDVSVGTRTTRLFLFNLRSSRLLRRQILVIPHINSFFKLTSAGPSDLSLQSGKQVLAELEFFRQVILVPFE